jgi:hypothetical protein
LRVVEANANLVLAVHERQYSIRILSYKQNISKLNLLRIKVHTKKKKKKKK